MQLSPQTKQKNPETRQQKDLPHCFAPIRLGSNLNDPHAFGKQHLKAHGKEQCKRPVFEVHQFQTRPKNKLEIFGLTLSLYS